MHKIRKGNDIDIRWDIWSGDGIPYSLEGRELAVYMETSQGRILIDDVTVSDKNRVSFTFYGKDQKYLGMHSVVLVENSGKKGMHTIDVCEAFDLVPCSCRCVPGDDAIAESLKFDSLITIGDYTDVLGEILDLCLATDFNEDFNNDFTIGL